MRRGSPVQPRARQPFIARRIHTGVIMQCPLSRSVQSTQPNVKSREAPRSGPLFIRKRRCAPAMLMVALICACSDTTVRIESRELVNMAAQSSERFIVVAVDDDSVAFPPSAGSTPRGYNLFATYGTTSHARRVMRSLEDDYGLREASAWPIERLHMHCAVLQLRDGIDRETLLATLRRDPRVKLAQPLQTFATRTAP